jgi:molybdate transport system substrate-binding protein
VEIPACDPTFEIGSLLEKRMRTPKLHVISLSAFFFALTFSCAFSPARAEEIVVSAAASLTDAMKEIGKEFEKRNPGITVQFNFGASGALQQQIEKGAPVDVFASAGVKEMDTLARTGKIEAATRCDFAGNSLVLLVPAGKRSIKWEDLAGARIQRVAISNPDSVPSGRYAKETLTRKNLWTAVQPKAIMGQNVRQTLTYIANGEVDAGIVFATDAFIEKRRVTVAQTAIPVKDHDPIIYPVAAIAGSRHAAVARRFATFLEDRTAQSTLKRFGFTSPNKTKKASGTEGIRSVLATPK